MSALAHLPMIIMSRKTIQRNEVLDVVRVKICGITSPQDALAAVQAGADAIGLQFYEGSIRCVDSRQALQIVQRMPPFVSLVGVFVNADRQEILEKASFLHLDYVQLHGDEHAELYRDFPIKTIKTVRVRSQEDLRDSEHYPSNALLLDSKVSGKYGGTGRTFDWSLIGGLTMSVPLILAGGLRPENVREAIETVNPQAVDVSSGVESAPAVKCYDKMRAFVQNAHGIAANL